MSRYTCFYCWKAITREEAIAGEHVGCLPRPRPKLALWNQFARLVTICKIPELPATRTALAELLNRAADAMRPKSRADEAGEKPRSVLPLDVSTVAPGVGHCPGVEGDSREE